MLTIADYTILESIKETKSATVYRAKKNGDNKTVIIKSLKNRSHSISDIARFKHEYDIIKNTDLDGVVKNIAFLQHKDKFALVFEDFNGVSLKDIIEKRPLDIKTFLKIGITLSDTLGQIHNKNIIHKDIKPQNIIMNQESGEVKITDFGIATVLTGENSEIFTPEVVHGTLAYMSPEQTGRMNRGIDYRTDLYSLGITFYELLTGNKPFTFNDPLEIMHAHIARLATSPIKLNSSIPKIISDITMKLISKMAEDRYQNSFGLMADLKICLNTLNEKGIIDNFELGGKDIPIKFQLPGIIIGRDKELEILLKSFDKLSSSTDGVIPTKLMLVSGKPGIGKSALINELRRPIVAKKGYFITGKYDQYRGDEPYSAIVQAFQGLIQQIISEGEDRISIWNKKLLMVLGSIGKVITDVIPMVSLITGDQPDIPTVGGEESINRFNYAFSKFVSVFAQKEHPLVLFLDDLQWADQASLKLLEVLISSPDISSLYIIETYRSNEVDSIHRFSKSLERIKLSNISFETINLKPLSEPSVNKLISSYLKCDESESLPLTNVVYNKTRGNPFFVNLFLKTLYEKKIIALDNESGWLWKIEDLSKLPLTDNVVDILINKIQNLPVESQEILKLCSGLGNKFDLLTISNLSGNTMNKTISIFETLINEGFILLYGNEYRFQHDHIQSAIYKLLIGNEREELHYKIVNFFILNLDKKEIINRIIFIADQLNGCKSIIKSKLECKNFTNINILAGQKSKKSAAYDNALAYFENGIECLDKNCWLDNYDQSLMIYTEAAEAAYLSTEYDKFQQFSDIVINNGKTLLDKIKIYELQILVDTGENKLLDAVNIGVETLKKLGLKFNLKPGVLHILIGLIKIKFILRNKSKNDLENLPKMTNPTILSAMKIMNNVGTSAYYASPNLLPLIIFDFIKYSIKYGNPRQIPYFYVAYGFVLTSLGDINGGYEYGDFGIKLLSKLDVPEQVSRTTLLFNLFIRHTKEHFRNTLEPFINSSEIAFETGDIEFACHSQQAFCFHSLHSGCELFELENKVKKYGAISLRNNQKTQYYAIILYHQTIRLLNGQDPYNSELMGSIYNENILLPLLIKSGDLNNIVNLHIHKMILNYYFEEFNSGLINSEMAKKYLDSVKGTLQIGILNFYTSLLLLASYPLSLDKISILRKVKKNQKKMGKFAKNAPMNYLHKYNLIEAEMARLNGDITKAVNLYNLSITGSKKNMFIQDESLANELCGKLWLDCGMGRYAYMHLKEARNLYKKWGANAKVKHLEKKYSIHIKEKPQKQQINFATSSGTSNSLTQTIDIATIIKTSQHLSSEIELKKLLEEIMNLSITNAGAQKGCLIKENNFDNKLYIEASGYINNKITTLQSIPIDMDDLLPLSIVNYVNRSKKNIIIQDAQQDPRFMFDKYIIKNKCKSILCLPIRYKGSISGILYLENSLITNAFTPERMEILQILSTQAAISIENADLYNKAVTDGLTQIYNRAFFDNYFIKSFAESIRYNKSLSLLILDIDHFKITNDTYGHPFGDQVLKRVASIIDNSTRESDLAARYGGEEFVVLLPETDIGDAINMGEKIRKHIENEILIYSESNTELLIKVTISIGVAQKRDNDDRISLLKRADKNLYKAKESGRNRVISSL